jgi:hypothetical protein
MQQVTISHRSIMGQRERKVHETGPLFHGDVDHS